jgi:hypothetical protein
MGLVLHRRVIVSVEGKNTGKNQPSNQQNGLNTDVFGDDGDPALPANVSNAP